jgi:ribosomal protein L11 methylase PrmA
MQDPASYRDPSGVVFKRDGVVYRQINRVFADDWARFQSSGLCSELTKARLLIPHDEAPDVAPVDDRADRVIKPLQLDFVSYPYEWSFTQLKDAALTTLEIQERALHAGMSLKDASAFNMQFVDGRPVLIDSLSFTAAVPGEPWVAYRQFCQHFLAPLALMAYRDVRCGLLLQQFGDGIPLDLATSLLPGRTRLRPGLGAHLHLHARAQQKPGKGSGSGASRARVSDLGRMALLDSLRRTVEGLRWKPEGTQWSGYTAHTSYSPAAAEAKAKLVGEMLGRVQSERVWDIGANTGTYSAIAAAGGRRVIAFDSDAGAVEQLYLRVRAGEMRGVLPLVLDIANPSPASGWALQERRSLIDRGPAPVVMALALIHHLAIARNVPLDKVSALLAGIGTELLIEFVPKEDPQTQTLLEARDDIFPDYTLDGFRAAFSEHFRVLEEAQISDSQRTLFLMRRIDA